MRKITFVFMPILLVLIACSCAVCAEPLEVVELPVEGSNCCFEFGVQANAVAVHSRIGDHYRLHLAAHREKDVSLDETQKTVDRAIRHVEKLLGPFRRSVHIFVADSIRPKNPRGKSGRVVAVCYKEDRTIIVLSKDRLTLPIVTHEFVHAWFNEQKHEPESWVEEGIAEYVETLEPNGYSEYHVKRLKELGFVDFARFGKTQVCTPERRHARSSSYWMVYHLVHEGDCDLVDVPRFVNEERYNEAIGKFASLVP